MYGLINRAYQSFLTDTYGLSVWSDAVHQADLGVTRFEALMDYPDEMTTKLMASSAEVLARSAEDLTEDLGTYLVAHPNSQSLRRLLRFGGTSFTEFLYSLDDLPDRARLAVPDLVVPQLALNELGPHRFVLECQVMPYPAGHVLMGILRAMADDYGALASLEYRGVVKDHEVIDITVHEMDFSEGRDFQLTTPETLQ